MNVASLARQILQIRFWQMAVNEDLKRGRYRIPVHLAIGHEAAAAAVCGAMSGPDQLALTHRNIAYHLARAGAIEPVTLEYQLSSGGAGHGRLGSMNLTNPERGIVYASSILGNNLPVACGLAMANAAPGRRAVVFAVTGDGAIEEGAFWESLVFARSHRLPVVFVVENNDHSLASTIEERRCPIRLGALCDAVGVRFAGLTGNEPGQYLAALTAARRQALDDGPACVEIHVATFNNHAGATPGWPSDPKSIDLGRGLVVEESPRDPVWVARGALDPDDYEATRGYLEALGRSLAASREAICRVI